VNLHLEEVKDVADKVGVGFIGLGAAPIWSHEQMPMMPKGRYKLMDSYMQRVGTMGQTMMRRTCTVQVNLDFSQSRTWCRTARGAGVAAGGHGAFRQFSVSGRQAQRSQKLARAGLARSRS